MPSDGSSFPAHTSHAFLPVRQEISQGSKLQPHAWRAPRDQMLWGMSGTGATTLLIRPQLTRRDR